MFRVIQAWPLLCYHVKKLKFFFETISLYSSLRQRTGRRC